MWKKLLNSAATAAKQCTCHYSKWVKYITKANIERGHSFITNLKQSF